MQGVDFQDPTLQKVGRLVRRQLASLVVVFQCVLEITARRRRSGAPCNHCCVCLACQRSLIGRGLALARLRPSALRLSRLTRPIQVEYRPTVVGEVNPTLTACDKDPMRQKEVGTQQHIEIAEVPEAQARVVHFLITDFQDREVGNPGLYLVPPDPAAIPRRLHARPVRFDPRLRRSPTIDDPAPVSNVTRTLAPFR